MSTKEDRRRVGLYPDNRVAPLLKTVGGKSSARRKDTKTSAQAASAGNDSKKRKLEQPLDDSDSGDAPSGDIRSQFDRGRFKSENNALSTRKTNDAAEPAYVAGSYKGTAFRGAQRKIEARSKESQRPKTGSRLVPKKNPSKQALEKPKFKSYAPSAASPPPKKPAFNDYGAREKSAPPSPVRKPTFNDYGARCGKPAAPSPVRNPTFKTYALSTPPPKSTFKDYGARENPEKPVFNTYGKIHPRDSDSDEISSQPHESPVRHILSDEVTTPPNDPNETKCPMCGTNVPTSLLLDFAAPFPSVDPFAMRIQVQSRFCSHHRRHTAASSANYPPISWHELPSRVRAHLPSIRAFLDDPDSEPSHYRDLLAKDITVGRNRTLMQSIMSEPVGTVRAPGYYGPRGARVMQDEILDELSKELREAAVRDVVVSARGVGVYVTSVLVLEVGLRLVMDDLGVGREEARGVMEKSAAWGTLVNEELDEEVSEVVEESDEFDW